MSKFDEYCDRLNALPKERKLEMIDELTSKILPALADLTEDGKDAVSIYVDFILAAVAADGKLAQDEYEIIKPLFDSAAGKDTTYEEAVEIFKNSGLDQPENYKKTVDMMVDLIGLVSEGLKGDIVSLCLLICTIDGEISQSEKDWIIKLVDDNFGYDPMEVISDYLDETRTFTLATVSDGKPRMRILGFKTVLDGKIYFAVGDFKQVYEQLRTNPCCEILASKGSKFLRWDGKAVFREDPRLQQAAEKALPQVIEMYKKINAKLAFFTIEGGSAEFIYVDNSKEPLF